MQLFIAGPRDKLFTVITAGAHGQGPAHAEPTSPSARGEPGFGGKTIGDLVAAQGRATAETLAKNGCPVRTIHVETLDEAALGELLMHFMLETIIAAQLLGVDAFDQPAVEEGKILAKQYLAGDLILPATRAHAADHRRDIAIDENELDDLASCAPPAPAGRTSTSSPPPRSCASTSRTLAVAAE